MQRPSRKLFAGLLCSFFISAHITVVSGLLGCPEALKHSPSYEGGWQEQQQSSGASEFPQEWNGVGEGQTRLLYKDYYKVTGRTYEPRHQGKTPACVGHAVAAAVDFLAHVEIMSGQPERAPPAPAAAGVIYGLSRVEIGGVSIKAKGGSHNRWACEAIKQYGVVARLNYALLNQDLRLPSAARALEFGSNGIPDGLELIAKLHPVKDYVRISSYEDARDALYMGSPIVVGSSQGFGDGKLTRDKDGFLNPPRRLFFPSKWKHSMCVIGVCDSGRKGVLIINSWGSNWLNGPKRFGDEPEGSFWVSEKIFNKMAQHGDCFALRGFEGYPKYKLWRP